MSMSTQVRDVEKKEMVPHTAEHTRARKVFTPRADIYESGDSIFVLADMPGVDENHLEIMLEKNILTITGFVEPAIPGGYTLAYAEYAVGDYKRVFTLSNEIDRDRIEATVKNGVLKLQLPKSKAVQARKISVRAE